MFDIMTLLLYYNLFAQSVEGLGMSAVAAGLSLLPLSVALFAFARAAPVIAARIGMRRMLAGGSLLLVLGCAIVWSSLRIEPKFVASAARPVCRRRGNCADLRFGAAARARRHCRRLQAGKGSGMLNSCSFLGGTVGVTFGGIVFALAGFSGVLVLLGISALASACSACDCMRTETAPGSCC